MVSRRHLIEASDSPSYQEFVRRVGQKGEPGWRFLIDAALTQLINNDKAVKMIAETAIEGLDWQNSVLDKDLTAPPGSPSEGDRYIVASGGTGDWDTHDDDIAEYDGSEWVFETPNKGFTAYVEDESRWLVFNGTAWVTGGGGADHGGLTGLGDDDHAQYLLEDGSRALSGDLDMGTNAITNVGNVDGVDVSAHAGGTAKAQHSALGDHDHSATGAEGGTISHADLTDKSADDHTQYLLAAGTRAMGGGLDMGGNAITNVGNVDGVDVSGHAGGTAYSQHTGGLGNHTHQSTGAEGNKLDHGLALDGLGDDDHTQYALLAGRSGGQTLQGSTVASEHLALESTANATKGEIQTHSSDLVVYSDGGSSEVARVAAASGNITTNGTVDGVDVAAHDHSSGTGQTRLAAKDRRRIASLSKDAADGAAATATAEHAIFKAPEAVTVTKVYFIPDSTLTADDTNYATLLVYRRDGDGTNQVTIGSIQTTITAGTNDWAAFVAEDFGSLSNTALTTGQQITVEITKAASGVVVPAGAWQVEYTVD